MFTVALLPVPSAFAITPTLPSGVEPKIVTRSRSSLAVVPTPP